MLYLTPVPECGLGFGGGCLPKDIRAFMARAGELGVDQTLSFLREVDSINMRRRVRMVDLAREECGGSITGRRIAVLGASFKPESDDVRDSPALSVAAQMSLQGAADVSTRSQHHFAQPGTGRICRMEGSTGHGSMSPTMVPTPDCE